MDNKIRALFMLFIVCLGAANLLITQAGTSDSTTKLSIPEFTLQYVDRSYDRPPTYEVDPLTGQNIVKESGYHVANRNIDVSINNQPFTPYVDSSGNWTRMYYGIRFKGHYEDQWKDIQEPKYYGYYNASQTNPTVITINLEYFYANSLNAAAGNQTGSSIQLDVQVEALIGVDYRIPTMTILGPSSYYEFNGQSSGYSDIHTIDLATNTVTTVPNTSSAAYSIQEFMPSPTAGPYVTSTPTVPEFPVLAVLPLVISLSLMAMLMLRKRRV